MSNRPLPLYLAAVVVALEGLTALGLGASVAVETFAGSPESLTSSIGVAVFGVLVGAALLWVAYGLLRGERWGRGPGVVAQIFLAPVAVTLIQSDRYVMGIVVAVVAVLGLVGLLAPATTAVLYHDDDKRR
ncbi:hypothetical protein [Sinosporangium siamense]|uniref:Integral membrane protein n=1 Tax=Sinosporangium siamense TaxID=1367973 RepID=A0A919REN7_9ACTN|nr:hypothetical protein [Sinosporangium siamense]GII92511.1 hypothetical protein Ssi02_27420 [Sinosporangium siamense]